MATVLRNRAFTLVWVAGLVSETGDWLLITGLPIYVFTQTGSSLITATVFICELIPSITLGSFTGVVVDRWDRRRVLIIVSLTQAALLLALLTVHSHDQLWVLYLVAVGEAVLTQFAEPAKNALLPTLIPPEQLVTANSLIALNNNLGRLVGSSLGGLAVASGTLTGITLGDAASFLIAAGLVVSVRPSRLPHRAQPHAAPSQPGLLSLRHSWGDGLRVITGTRTLRVGFLSAAIQGISQGVFVVLFVVFISDVLHGNATEIGLLRGVQAIGGILGGLLLSALGTRIHTRHLITGGALSFGLLSAMTWNMPLITMTEGIYLGLFIAMGIPGMAYLTGVTALLQQNAPHTHLGRVFGAFYTLNGAFQAFGMLLAGILATDINVVTVLNGQATLYLLAGSIAFLGLRHSTPISRPSDTTTTVR